jgi:hypothetical protein
MKGLWIMVLPLMLLAMSGCAGEVSADVNIASMQELVHPPTAPVRIGLCQDITGSTTFNRVDRLSQDNLTKLIQVIKKRGGELAVGTLSDDSDRSMLRLRIEEPPVTPREPTPKDNPFVHAQKMRVYKTQLTDYENAKRKWERESSERVNNFLAKADKLLSQPVLSRHSDVWGAVERADLFLAEEESSWSLPANRYLILVTDGEDNVGTKFCGLRSIAKTILVNGAGKLGNLGMLKPIRFESAAAAIHWVAANELK